MSLFLIKHDDGRYRLHKSDGSETGDSWTWGADWLDERSEDMTAAVESAVGGASWNYRDLTIDGETVPW